ncbi:MAG: D-alanine--D-alanine ligase [Firmicutes bacterium]|nr:D-alanine--D-alanine ligase [Bacillota bacterium]
MAKQKIAVIFGGNSSEHEISRLSARNVINNLDKEKYEVLPLGITKEGEWLLYSGDISKLESGEWEKSNAHKAAVSSNAGERCIFVFKNDFIERVTIDAAFIVLHGKNGEDGTVQGLLTLADIPYTGCGVLSSALCMDKCFAKQIFEVNEIAQAQWLVFNKYDLSNPHEIQAKVLEKFSYPVFVKPSSVGSSIGAQKVDASDSLISAIKEALCHDAKVLVEQYVKGREIECAVMGNDAPQTAQLSEIVTTKAFYDYEAKYSEGFSYNDIPAALSKEKTQEICSIAKKAYLAAGCKGFARVDFFVENGSERVLLNEINTIPGFTDKSAFPLMWQKSGVCFSALLDKIIAHAMEG